ncbi:Cytochrome c oxidase assembly protein COX15 [Hibiscus syriacus]|uniref:Cytochrome c oxidase assembly protein COX15 n=1 Tax=Hibiscus syriacus TaxID=106335 RepID=A0A6A3AG80_HIBSY|nr:Cytochrome c oxidase assembly protein COX15 [Hibiscus syriacus]
MSSFRKMSTEASVGAGEGLKQLVTAGQRAQKMVGIWLFGSAAWVFSMVVLGGVTRLTRSGLSMTDWKFMGTFLLYLMRSGSKSLRNTSCHQNTSGVMFALPFSYFLRKGYITVPLGLRLSALFALGAGQGLIGWWMVKSGLEWPVLDCSSVVMPEPPAESLAWVQGAAKVRRLAIPVSLIVGITAVSGALLLEMMPYGRAYNTFPKMGDVWVPDNIFDLKPIIRNFFENTSMVQFDLICGLWWWTKRLDVHPAIRSLVGATFGMAALQVTLGVSTLLSYVPISLGTAHQAGALTLLTLMLLLAHTVRKPSMSLLKTLPQVEKNGKRKCRSMGECVQQQQSGLVFTVALAGFAIAATMAFAGVSA